MKKLLFITIVLLSFSTQAQFYIDASLDPNKLFNVIDNPRTEVDHQGVDWDLELGVASSQMGAYIYYGRFDAMKWQNYGAGVDYYITRGDWYDISVGGQVNFILREAKIYNEDGSFHAYREGVWGSSLGFGARLVGTFWVLDNLGLSGRFQYITRPDLDKTFGIVEGSVGVRYKFN